MFARLARGLRQRFVLGASLCVTSTLGCASTGPYVWIDSLPVTAEQASPYIISPGDMLDVRVYNEERHSARGRVRVDGRITLPLLGDVAAAGKAPAQLAEEIKTRLTSLLQSPIVTVQVDETHPSNFSLVGELTRPGVFPLPANTGLLEALAIGGGLTQYADPEAIYVLRKAMPQRIRVTYRALIENEPHAVAFRLRDGDVIVVE